MGKSRGGLRYSDGKSNGDKLEREKQGSLEQVGMGSDSRHRGLASEKPLLITSIKAK